MTPEVLYLILCDQVQTDPSNYHRLTILGLITSIRSSADPPFPVVQPLFCALVLLTGGRGSGELDVRVVENQTGTIIFRTRRREVRFIGDPAAVLGMRFHIRNCSFPAGGLYWVEVVYEGTVLARQKLFLKV